MLSWKKLLHYCSELLYLGRSDQLGTIILPDWLSQESRSAAESWEFDVCGGSA